MMQWQKKDLQGSVGYGLLYLTLCIKSGEDDLQVQVEAYSGASKINLHDTAIGFVLLSSFQKRIE